MPFIPGVYRHFKGNLYAAVLTAKNSENPEELFVVYRALYGAGEVWVRPLTMWQETVCVDQTQVARFTFVRPFAKGENPLSLDFDFTRIETNL